MTAPVDLLALPVDSACNPRDTLSHHWVLDNTETKSGDWHMIPGRLGEHRDLRCDNCAITTRESRWNGIFNPPLPQP